MFERFKRSSRRDPSNDGYGNGAAFERGNGYTTDGNAGNGYAENTAGAPATGAPGAGATAADERTAVVDQPTGTRTATGARTAPGTTTAAAPVAAGAGAPASAAEARAIQRERFGGSDGTAIFFGWLSALGLAALVIAVVAAAGTRLGFANNVSTSDATNNAGTIGIVGAAILVVILLLAYYAGGYVAGRMARFDGGRQGLRVWLLGLLVTIAAAIAGWIGGSQYNVFQQLNLPRIPVDEGSITTGAIITLIVVLVGTLLAAMAGGKAGDRYHARVDASAWDRPRV